MPTEIPQPPTWPLIGNMADLWNTHPSQMADKYGPIFKLQTEPGKPSRIFISTAELLDIMCDETRFVKNPTGAGLAQVRNVTGDGLFTALHGEENWGIAHRVLLPAFGPIAIINMFDEMYELACQLVSKWARHGPLNKIPVTEDFTRLTLDSIALCAMDTRFNSFYREGLHPFVEAMGSFLVECGRRSARPGFATDYIYRATTKKYWEDVKVMRDVGDAVVEERRSNPSSKNDLVNAMINGFDPKTGKCMSDTNITDNMITLLIAGHETTSGLLSFLFYELTKNPRVFKLAQQEVDNIIGTAKITNTHLSKLPYLSAMLRETLRLHPTAPGFSAQTLSENPDDYPLFIGKNQYKVNQGETLTAILPRIHKDPVIWGDNADEFKPERMLDHEYNKLPKNCYKPWGNGARGCIGRAFAWQEAHIVVALLLQNFDFRPFDPNYQLEIAHTLTVKPKKFFMHCNLRNGDPMTLERRLWSGSEPQSKTLPKDKTIEAITSASRTDKRPMSIFYGSNTGTAKAFAHSLASEASNRGFQPKVNPLDSAVNNIPKGEPVIIIVASYEGEPPDNAVYFIEWLRELTGDYMNGSRHAVFGCGNRDWVATFQKVPILVDNLLQERGSSKLVERGFSDAADGDMFNSFDKWMDETLWPAIFKQYGVDVAQTASSFNVEILVNSRSTNLGHHNMREAVVRSTRLLTTVQEPQKYHLELELPEGITYGTGDYLAVLPINRSRLVKDVMARFGLGYDAEITINQDQNTFLPASGLKVFDLLSTYVELNQPATQKNVFLIASSIDQEELGNVVRDIPTSEILEKRISVFDLLQKFPMAKLTFGDFLSTLPPMRSRQYSISSSPLDSPSTCSISYSVVDEVSKFTKKRFFGTASKFLSELEVNDRVWVSISPHHVSFRLPSDSRIPLVMACAGSGLAPFRGFVRERMNQIATGQKVAPALLFIGCRHPERDALYADEVDAWRATGAADVRYAFSMAPEISDGCKYVQDRMWKDRKYIMDLFDQDGKIFACGGSKVVEGISDAFIRTYSEYTKKSREETERWFVEVRNERFSSDVFA